MPEDQPDWRRQSACHPKLRVLSLRICEKFRYHQYLQTRFVSFLRIAIFRQKKNSRPGNELHPKSWTPPTERVQFFMTKYSKEEKLAAIKAVEAGESIAQVSRQSQINYSLLKWIVRSYREHGEKGLSSHAYNWTGEQNMKYWSICMRTIIYQRNQYSIRDQRSYNLELGEKILGKRDGWIGR